MKANISLAFRGRTPEEHASQNGHILLFLNSQGKILRQIPLGGDQYNFTVEIPSLEILARALSEFKRHNPWLKIVAVHADA